MPEQTLIERLDEAIEALLRGEEVSRSEAELGPLLVIASDLRDLPNPEFRVRLKEELMPASVVPYLMVDGAAGLITFLKEAFDAVELGRFPAGRGKIMHAEVQIGGSPVELADMPPNRGPFASALHLYVENADATWRRAVDAGATPIYAPMDQPYGDREGGVRDRWGNNWYIGTRKAGGPRPEGYGTVTPGLQVRGAAQLVDFVSQAFGATPFEEPARAPDGSIVHAALRLGGSMIEVGEAHGEFKPMKIGIHLHVPDADAVYERALRAGAKSVTPPEKKPYGERSATVEDAAGNLWFIATLTRVRVRRR